MSMDSSLSATRIEEIAADWLARRDGEAWTASDEAEFEAWQNQSTLHRVAVIRLKAVWQQADRLRALGEGVPAGSIVPPGKWRLSAFAAAESTSSTTPAAITTRKSRIPGTPHRISWTIAAACLLLLSFGWIGYSSLERPDSYGTAVGDQRTIRLSDGSQVILNTDSLIKVDFSDTQRSIQLARGEAFFEVAKDSGRPFVVHADDTQVVAVGTAFSVRREYENLRVVVTEGKVSVSTRGTHVRPGEPPIDRPEPVVVGAGNVAHASLAGVLVTESSVPDAERALSWRAGYILLRDTPLSEAIAEFNRYNERQLVLGDPALASVRVGGNLRLKNVDAFVRVLEQGFAIHAQDRDDRIVLTRR